MVRGSYFRVALQGRAAILEALALQHMGAGLGRVGSGHLLSRAARPQCGAEVDLDG